jgi:hypothetical protein
MKSKPLQENRFLLAWAIILSPILLAILMPAAHAKREKTLQGIMVTGTVMSSVKEETLPGVTIVVKGTTIGTVTDAAGKYSLVVPNSTDILVFSSVGFKSEEIPVDGRSVIDLSMAEDLQNLDEVVVVGYGIQKKVSVTSAVSQIK